MRRFTLGTICICVILSCLTPANATEYFICNQAGTGAGTLANPYRLGDLPSSTDPDVLGTACSVLQAGDTLTFLGGTYTITAPTGGSWNYAGYIRPSRDGTATNPITFRAKPGDTVTLVYNSGDMTLLGNMSKTGSAKRDYVRFRGFYIVLTGSKQAISFQGGSPTTIAVGCEAAFNDVTGTYVDTGYNHFEVRLTYTRDCVIRYNELHDCTGQNWNNNGVTQFVSSNMVVTDNYFHDNTAGVYDKDSGNNNLYEHNFFVNNTDGGFYGNNQGSQANYTIRNNVFFGKIVLHYKTTGATVNDNLIRQTSAVDAWAGQTYQTNWFNNIVAPLATTGNITAYTDTTLSFTTTPPYNQFAYCNYNAYTLPPVYAFLTTKTLAQMQSSGLELNSTVASAALIFVDTVNYQVKAPYTTAGRYGDCLGPDNTAIIMDTSRYGPAGVPIPSAATDSYTTTMNQQLVVANPGVLSNDTATRGWALSAVKMSDPSHGTLVLSSTGGFTYTPTTGYTGSDSFTYQAVNEFAESTACTVSITVTGGVPTAVNDTYTWYANKTLSVSAPGVLANDTGTGMTAIKVSDPSHGSVTLNSDGSFAYSSTGYTGSDSFTYKAHNGGGDSNTATVNLTINEPTRILVDCGNSPLSSTTTAAADGRYWNNMTAISGSPSVITSCTNSTGSLSGIKLTRTTNFEFVYYNGISGGTTVNGWPYSAARDFLAMTNTANTGTMEFSLLDASGSTKYDLTVFGSSNSGSSQTLFTVLASSTTSKQVDCSNSQTTRWATFNGLTPDANGKITLQVKLVTAGGKGSLNIMDLAAIHSDGSMGMMMAGGGLESQLAAAQQAAPAAKQAAAINVNFQPAGAAAPEGYLADSGLAFADRGNGQSYGWAKDLSAFAVQKNSSSSPDARYDTAIMLLKDATWEVAVPNGMYSVKIVAGGDAATIKSQKFTVEGVPTTQAKTGQYLDQTVTVVVTDGKLTITGQAGSSICFVQIAGQ